MTFIEQIRTHPVRFLKTLALYCAMLAIGVQCGLTGPTLLDLAIAVDEPFERIAFCLPLGSIGWVIGSCTSKLTNFDCINSY